MIALELDDLRRLNELLPPAALTHQQHARLVAWVDALVARARGEAPPPAAPPPAESTCPVVVGALALEALDQIALLLRDSGVGEAIPTGRGANWRPVAAVEQQLHRQRRLEAEAEAAPQPDPKNSPKAQPAPRKASAAKPKPAAKRASAEARPSAPASKPVEKTGTPPPAAVAVREPAPRETQASLPRAAAPQAALADDDDDDPDGPAMRAVAETILEDVSAEPRPVVRRVMAHLDRLPLDPAFPPLADLRLVAGLCAGRPTTEVAAELGVPVGAAGARFRSMVPAEIRDRNGRISIDGQRILAEAAKRNALA